MNDLEQLLAQCVVLDASTLQANKTMRFGYQQAHDQTLRISMDSRQERHEVDFEDIPQARLTVTAARMNQHFSTHSNQEQLVIQFHSTGSQIKVLNPGEHTEVTIDDGLMKLACTFDNGDWHTQIIEL